MFLLPASIGMMAGPKSAGPTPAALLHFNGADASTTFTDEVGNVWTANGNAQIDTAQSQFGGASGLFDGTGDFITTPSSNFDIGTGDFTIECFVRRAAASIGTIFSERASLGGMTWRWNADGTLTWFVANGTNTFTTSNAAALSTWTHVAVARQSGTVRMFVGGTLGGSAGSALSLTTDKNATAYIGRRADSNAEAANGHIDEFRMVIGTAVYTANFTPPTVPFPDS